MNTRRTVKDWDHYAHECGCGNLRQLLYKYYVERGMTTREIGADILDTSKDRVVQLLRANNIPLRRRGGIR